MKTLDDFARTIADALYRHRYPRAMSGVADRTHASHARIWAEADAIVAALYRYGRLADVIETDIRGRAPGIADRVAVLPDDWPVGDRVRVTRIVAPVATATPGDAS